MLDRFDIIDISQPISSATACFPGDVPFSRQITASFSGGEAFNLCAFTMSPHVGTHADAPVHIRGELEKPETTTEMAGGLPLSPYIGPAVVVDVSPCNEAITWAQVQDQLAGLEPFPQRILFKTSARVRSGVFEEAYACFSPELVGELAQRGVVLMGLDTPSVDPIHSKTLETHHALLEAKLCWLENLDLTHAPIGKPECFLVALPLKFTELEASPVRAVLLQPR